MTGVQTCALPICGGWWQLEPSRTAVVYVHCEHCDGTGVEPGPAVQRTLDVEEYL